MNMKMTEEGLALIRRFEGFRSQAYRDAVGVWTIGYGHTAMAGPPTVTAGQRISADEAVALLARDVQRLADGVAAVVRQPLSDQQFSALVSFAYNVGLGNFRKSSVLKAVNAGDFAAVPRRLNLWVKAGGRTLPGLVKRRAAEGALFLADDTVTTGEAPGPRAPVEAVRGKPLRASRTMWAAAVAALAACAQGFSPGRVFAALLVLVAVAAAAIIIFERIRKLKEEGL
jgi:lysozyme